MVSLMGQRIAAQRKSSAAGRSQANLILMMIGWSSSIDSSCVAAIIAGKVSGMIVVHARELQTSAAKAHLFGHITVGPSIS